MLTDKDDELTPLGWVAFTITVIAGIAAMIGVAAVIIGGAWRLIKWAGGI